MKQVDLHHGAATDVGLVRKVNEDSFLVAPPVFVVADGMGGHSGGDVASQIVVEEFARLAVGYDPARGAEHVADAFARAQARIVGYGDAHRAVTPGWHAGTTAVVAVLVDDDGVTKWLLANLGDSRIYRLTEGRLEQVSVDHSVVQELDRRRRDHPGRRRPSTPSATSSPVPSAAPRASRPTSSSCPWARSSGCCSAATASPGWSRTSEIEGILETVPDPRDAADRLVRAAVAAGGRDNATAIVVDVVGLVHDASYDSQRQRQSLESKLGGRQ